MFRCCSTVVVTQQAYLVTLMLRKSSTCRLQHAEEGARTHACRQATPDSYIISSWSFLPASTRKRVVGPLRTAPCHSAPAGQTGKYRKNIFSGYGQTWPMLFVEGKHGKCKMGTKRKSVYWFVKKSTTKKVNP